MDVVAIFKQKTVTYNMSATNSCARIRICFRTYVFFVFSTIVSVSRLSGAVVGAVALQQVLSQFGCPGSLYVEHMHVLPVIA